MSAAMQTDTDRIAKLEAANEHLRAEVNGYAAECGRLFAEVERLRNALDLIAKDARDAAEGRPI